MKKKKVKKGQPAFTWIASDGSSHVISWWLSFSGGKQSVPAIEESRITVVRFPIAYYQHFDYSPEAMALRPKRIAELGWYQQSFDLALPPEIIGSYCLMSDSLESAAKTLKRRDLKIDRIYPSMIKVSEKCSRDRTDYCVLFFGHYAYEFYHFFFILGQKHAVTFENIPDPPIATLAQALKWVKSFEHNRRVLYNREGFTWDPIKDQLNKEGNA